MILPFSTKLNRKPTYFVERIHKGIRENYMLAPVDPSVHYPADYNFIAKDKLPSKYHSVREDKNNRWKVDTKIDFFINARQKNMFRFASVLPVISIQKIEFILKDNTENLTCLGTSFDKTCTIIIDERFYGDAYFFNGTVISSSYTIPIFANNDGFDTSDELFAYFNKNFKGKIIHWTNLKY
jgi:hypothetical protein